MKLSGGQIAVRALEDEGIPFAFGIPGTHNLELYDALGSSRKVRPILVTHEQSAPFMADGVWRTSGRLACVNLVPGAGLTHALSGIAEAFLDQSPMLILCSGIRRDISMGYQLHDIAQREIAAPITKASLLSPSMDAMYETIRKACRIAREGTPGPVMVEVPSEQFLFRTEFRNSVASPNEDARGPASPAADDLDRAATILNQAERPLIYVGFGARSAGSKLVALAETLNAPVATTIQGKGVFPETHPLFLWPGFGRGAPAFVQKIVRDCDATLAIGCRFGEVATASYGAVPPQPLVHIDLDPAVLGRNYPVQTGIAADASLTVRGLIERVRPRSRDGRLQVEIASGHSRVQRRIRRAGRSGKVTPALLLAALQEKLGPDAVYAADSGNGMFLAMEALRLAGPGRLIAPVDYSCMGYSVPAAIGARLACPDAPVVALVGDGAFLMTGLEMMTAVNYGLPLALFVLRDRELAQIAQFQSIAMGRTVCSTVGNYNLCSLATSVGAEFLSLEHDSEIDETLRRLGERLSQNRVVVIDVAIDYSRRTYFTRGVMRTNLGRLPFADRLRFIGRSIARRILP